MTATMTEIRLPFIVKLTCVLLSLIAVIMLLYFGREFLSPIALSALFAVLLYPIVRFLSKYHVPEVAAIIIAIIVLTIIFSGLVYFTAAQMSQFSDEWPQLQKKIEVYSKSVQTFAEHHLGIEVNRQLKEGMGSIFQSGATVFGDALLAFSNFTLQLFLIPIYIFLFLYYRKLWTEFFLHLTSRADHHKVGEILRNASRMVQQYLFGRAVETVIVAALNAGALLLLGIDGALLFGLLDGILNLIPFVGVVIGSALPALMALLTKDSAWYAVAVIGAHLVIQFIDNHLILPFFVGGKVNINSLAAIAGLFIGGAIWGIMGLVLSLPIIAIVKVVFDQIEPLKPWGLLLGDAIPDSHPRHR